MPRTSAWLILTGAVLITMITITPHYSRAQLNPSLQTGFSQAIAAVHNAEAAGATPNETAPLVAMLNEALALNQEASSLPSNQTTQRNTLLSSANQFLTNVTNRANDLTSISTRGTYTNTVITYVIGIVAAVVGTFVYVFGVELYQRYRIKRTFEMKVSSK